MEDPDTHLWPRRKLVAKHVGNFGRSCTSLAMAVLFPRMVWLVAALPEYDIDDYSILKCHMLHINVRENHVLGISMLELDVVSLCVLCPLWTRNSTFPNACVLSKD